MKNIIHEYNDYKKGCPCNVLGPKQGPRTYIYARVNYQLWLCKQNQLALIMQTNYRTE